MCGIAGIYNLKINANNEALVKNMTNAMVHRGPDADGFFSDDKIALGHRRLSIIDLSENANQPIYDTTNNYIIIFNGEIYNYKELKSKLADYNYKTNGDTEVVLAGYLKWGANVVDHLIGMFAFAIYNKSNNELFIARDRLGVKPIYYFNDDSYFIFSSELRSILASGIVSKKINTIAIQDYLATQSFAPPFTIIQNIYQLEAGSYIFVKDENIETKVYWSIDKPNEHFEINDAPTAKKKVYDLMLQSVERRLVADVPVAAFLSGGIDSSAIVGLMAQIKEAPQTFNIAFNEAEYDESNYAEIVAQKFNTQHHKILLQPQTFLDELTNALDAMDIPSGDGINSYVVSKEIVKNKIKVAMTGAGGDELFAGYPSFKQWYSINQKQWLWKIPKSIRNIATSLLPSNHKTERIKRLLKEDKLTIEKFYPLVREVLSKKQIDNLLKLKSFPFDTSNSKPATPDFPLLSQFTIAELTGYTHDTLLKDTDQFSMAVSLEVREPFFDHQLIEYVLQIPDKFKYPNYPKQLFVESLGDLLPNEIVHRKKKGFTFPWEYWLKNELKDFCQTNIKNLASRDFMNTSHTISLWNNFVAGKSVRWSEIWILVVLEYWLQKNDII
jgi:asparagine synthase (glutamine-hydrolysing)